MRRKTRLGLVLTCVVALLTSGWVVASAVADTTPRPEPGRSQGQSTRAEVIRLGTLGAPARGAIADGRTLRIRRGHTRPFAAYGVNWAHGSGVVEVASRVRQYGRWTRWHDLDVDEPGRRGARTGANLVWTGPATGIEVAVRTVRGAHPRDVRVDLIDPGEAPGDAEAATVTSADLASTPAVGPVSGPTILRRADWGADESKMTWDPEYADSVLAVVLHHTAHSPTDSNDYAADDVPAIIRSIYHYQAVTLGWGDIGYNVLVDRFGRLWEGRYGGLDKPVIGAHAGGFNRGTAGIAMLGDHTTTPVPAVVVDAAARYAGWKLGTYRADPRGTTQITGGPSNKYPAGTTLTVPRVFPHRETSYTECPGDEGLRVLGTIREDAYWFARWVYPNRGPWPTTSGSPAPPSPRTSWR